jgi:hypothetical protein
MEFFPESTSTVAELLNMAYSYLKQKTTYAQFKAMPSSLKL